jgi:hypothetical protein
MTNVIHANFGSSKARSAFYERLSPKARLLHRQEKADVIPIHGILARLQKVNDILLEMHNRERRGV